MRALRVVPFLAKRLSLSPGGGRNPYLAIATIAVTLSVATMLLATAIGNGFQHAISQRALAIVGNAQVLALDANRTWEQQPVDSIEPLLAALRALPGVTAYPFAYKPTILKTRDGMQAAVLKGIDSTMPATLLKPFLVRGGMLELRTAETSNGVLISETLAKKLLLDTGDAIDAYFVQDPPRVRRLRIRGIYSTQMPEFDNRMLFADVRHAQNLSGWTKEQYGGIAIHAPEREGHTPFLARIQPTFDSLTLGQGRLLRLADMEWQYSAIFDWLSLLRINVVVLLALMALVATVNMITLLLIIILNRTRTIGQLRALGASGRQVRGIFIWQAARILLLGLAIGNALALALIASQQAWRWFRLDPNEYYIDHVPLLITLGVWLLINVGTVAVVLLALLVPSSQASRISPAMAVKWE